MRNPYVVGALSVLTPAIIAAQSTVAIDSLITREMRERRIPGVSYAVVNDGKIVLKKAYGYRIQLLAE